jgi:hypothetical protein
MCDAADARDLQLAKARVRASLAIWCALGQGLVLAALLCLVWWALNTPLGDYGRVAPG